ncbi:chemokine-like receptor 1 [Rana temporaria]|uniref:chemokine-like receptor 1 n=1 Tax=Rana temporaria TaxID=8407 RepID=UPI001AAC484E|nr:chemokine-like receptor 1 [Rana temporaria]XP_040183356.1 chemokine-like receptor 1 [Rana temporaria]
MKNFTMEYPVSNVTLKEETTIPWAYYESTPEVYSEEDERLERIAFHLRVFSLVIYSFAFVLGTTGNGLVIYFTAFVMKRTVNVVWFLNLAIADFIFTFFLPLSITHASLEYHWPFGKFMCKLNSTILFINLYASIFLLTMISIDRFISVVFPVWCQNHRTPKLASFIAVAVWILAFIFSLPYFIFRDIYGAEEDHVSCYNNFHEDEKVAYPRHKATLIIRFIVSFFIPLIIIISCYSVILLRIQRNHMTTSNKPFKVVLAVIISFFVCWFPYHVFSFLELSANYDENEHLYYITFVGIPITSSLVFINSCINPILYVFMGRDFKQKFHSSLRSIFERAFSEESTQIDSKSKTKSTSDSQLV